MISIPVLPGRAGGEVSKSQVYYLICIHIYIIDIYIYIMYLFIYEFVL